MTAFAQRDSFQMAGPGQAIDARLDGAQASSWVRPNLGLVVVAQRSEPSHSPSGRSTTSGRIHYRLP